MRTYTYLPTRDGFEPMTVACDDAVRPPDTLSWTWHVEEAGKFRGGMLNFERVD